jgi:hypothetical protein
VINSDRMWHYVEGIANWNPVWPMHGIRILPGPSSLWLDADGKRLPAPLYPGFDTLGTLEHLRRTGHDYSWFILTKKIIAREFALSGSEQNPDLTGRDRRAMITSRFGGAVPGPVQAFLDHGEDFVTAATLPDLVSRMNALTGGSPQLSAEKIGAQILARDADATRRFGKDQQAAAIRRARAYLGDRLMRVAKPHALLDPAAGPLIAVRLHVLTRKTLGGLHTDLSSRVLSASGQPVPGLYAAGEAAGFGGGGMHGYRSLEGTFLGGCLFSGRIAGRAAAAAVALPGLVAGLVRRAFAGPSPECGRQCRRQRKGPPGRGARRPFSLLRVPPQVRAWQVSGAVGLPDAAVLEAEDAVEAGSSVRWLEYTLYGYNRTVRFGMSQGRARWLLGIGHAHAGVVSPPGHAVA